MPRGRRGSAGGAQLQVSAGLLCTCKYLDILLEKFFVLYFFFVFVLFLMTLFYLYFYYYFFFLLDLYGFSLILVFIFNG